MPNQLNFPNNLPTTIVNERPSRLKDIERKFFESGTKQVIFGTNKSDVLEIWVYFADGRVAGHTTLPVTDSSVKLVTAVDNTGAYEFVNIELGELVRTLGLEQGRYALVVNVFRNEVGSSDGNKLYIDTISSDRTELRLIANSPTNLQLREMYEFAVPSVPRLEAQALTDQLFGENIDTNSEEQLTSDKVLVDVDLLIIDTSDRLTYAEATTEYALLTQRVIDMAYGKVLDNMSNDTQNLNIQNADLEKYISSAVQETIRLLRSRGEIDNRFEVF
jgi:hypothetical protein